MDEPNKKLFESDLAESFRRRFLTYLSLIAIAASGFFLVLDGLQRRPADVLMNLVMLITFSTFLVLLRTQKTTARISSFLLIFSAIVLLYYSFSPAGGRTAVLWGNIFPLLAFFLRGKKGVVWTGAYALVAGALAGLGLLGVTTLLFTAREVLEISIGYAMVVTLVYFYHRLTEQSERVILDQRSSLAEEVARWEDSQVQLQKVMQEMGRKNVSLSETQAAMLNLLEDARELEEQLRQEKAGVEKKVEERTRDLAAAKAGAEEERRTLATLLENLPVGAVVARAPGGEVLTVNKRGVEILGKGVDPQARRGSYAEVYSVVREDGTLYPEKELPLSITLKEGKSSSKRDVFIRKQDDTLVALRVSSAPIKDVQGKMGSVVVVFEDITKEHDLERARDEFFSIASHELRTPLTAIRGNSSLLLQHFSEHIKDRDMREMIEDIHQAATRLIDIVNDFLETSRLELGRVIFKPESFELAELVRTALREYQVAGSHQKIYLHFEEPDEKIPPVWADPPRVRQVLVNLVGNGLKFTKSGGVTVRIKPEREAVTVFVADTGLGIDSGQKRLLFKKFQQAGPSLYTRNVSEGTGLGLYISKKLMEGMGGKVWLEKSDVHKGSTFAFTLPVAKP